MNLQKSEKQILNSLVNSNEDIHTEVNAGQYGNTAPNLHSDDVLRFAIENGIIDLQCIESKINMIKRDELLSKHKFSIWQGNDGKFYTYLPDKNAKYGRVLKKRTTRKDIEDVVVAYWDKHAEIVTLESVFNEWNNRKLDLKQISNATYSRNKAIFKRHFSDICEKHISDITPLFIEDYLEQQIPKFNLTAKGFAKVKGITRGIFKRAKKQGYIDFSIEDVFNGMELEDRIFHKVVKDDSKEVFNEEETDLMFEYLLKNIDPHNLGILLMFVTGLRVGELVALKQEDFDGNTIKVRRTETRFKDFETGKVIYEIKDFPKTEAGVRTVVVPSNYEWLIKRIRLQNPFGEYVFMYRGKRIKTEAIRKRLKRVCKNLGIVEKTPHKIRKTYGSILIDNNIDTRFITDQMGHTDILCTETHYHRNRKTVEKKSQILSNIPDFQKRVVQ